MKGKKYIATPEGAEFVRTHAALGIRLSDIAKLMDISCDTIERHYQRDFWIGVQKANAKVAQSLYQQAINGNVKAQIFWLKTRAKWREFEKEEIEEIKEKIVYSWLGEEEHAKGKEGSRERNKNTV